jgi:ribosome-binding protein aMBF1 (putative translation factor)
MAKTSSQPKATPLARRRTPTVRKDPSADEAAMRLLVPAEDRADFDVRVKAALARNAALATIEEAREQKRLSKRDLADQAGLDPSAVRRLLTSETANPTSDNIFRLMGALGIRITATTPSGKTVSLI